MKQEYEQMRLEPIDTDLNARELIILSNLYCSMHWPYNSMTADDLSEKIGCTKITVIRSMEKLEQSKMIIKVRGFVTFYYPTADRTVRNHILRKIGMKE